MFPLGDDRTGRRRTGGDPPGERIATRALLLLGALSLLVLVTGHLSALAFNGGWPRYPGGAIPGILVRFVASPLDPAAAWEPVNRGTQPAGPVGWWLTLVVLLALPPATLVALARRADRAAEREQRDQVRRATGRIVHRARLEQRSPTQVVVGWAGRRPVAPHPGDSLLVMGPRGAGKTNAVTVPAVLRWPGPVVAAMATRDLVDCTIGYRSHQGDVHVFDPAAVTRRAPSGWSPLAGADTWAGATRSASDLATAGMASFGTASVNEPWVHSEARFLAPYLLAAAVSSRTMEDVARWIDTEEYDGVAALLRQHPEAARVFDAKFHRDDATRDSLLTLMGQTVGAYLDPRVAASARNHEIHADELLDGDPHTLYLVAPHHSLAQLRPLLGALLRQVLAAAHQRVAVTGAPLDPPLLLILDDAAAVAPLPDLATLAETGGGDGVQLVSVFRDLTQVEGRYGEGAAAVERNHRARLLLPRSGGVESVALAERVNGDGAGDRDRPVAAREAIAPELAARIPADHAVLLTEGIGPLRVRLRPWYKDRELRIRAGVVQDSLPAAAGGDSRPATAGRGNGAVPPEGPRPNGSAGAPGSRATGPDIVRTASAFDPTEELPERVDTAPPPELPPNVSPITGARNRSRRRGRSPSRPRR